MGFAERLMRQVGPHVTPGANVIAIDMATSPDVDPPGPVGVVVTDAEVLLVASGRGGGHLTTLSRNDIVDVRRVDDDVVALAVDAHDEMVLDFRYFGITDDTVTKLLHLR